MASLVAMYKQFDFGHMRVTKRAGAYKHLRVYKIDENHPDEIFHLDHKRTQQHEEAAHVRSLLMTKDCSNPSRRASRL